MAIITSYRIRHQGVYTSDKVSIAPGSIVKHIGEQLRLIYSLSKFRSAKIESAIKIIATINNNVVI
jgi:hypothetical protein